MESARWDRIQELFHAAADLPAAQQRAYLGALCGGDEGLVAEVMALFDEDLRRSSPLDRGLAAAAHGLFRDATVPPPIAEQLGPYRILRRLGEGGMGVVYLAERTDLGSLVAIKILTDAWLSAVRRERFAAEQRTLAQLDHPSIARLYDAGALDDGTPFFVMEYVEGVPLTEHCRQRSAGVEERLHLFRALCEAVQFAHRHAIIHRDIKPSNVLVKPDGSVRLLDFGIAKQVEHIDAPTTRTRTGFLFMTPAYAAPEQFRGDRVGVYTDVYSLGVVLYELLCGRLPPDRSAVYGDGADREPDRPSAAPGAIAASRSQWADLDVLATTAMQRDPQRRYGSVEALIRDIDHCLRGEPLEARPEGLAHRVRKFVSRNRRPVLLASATVILVVGLVAFFTARLATARDAAVAEAGRTHRIRDFMERMLTGGDQYVGPGKELRVVTLLDTGVKEARALDEDPEVQAELFGTLGSLYHALGELDTADELLRAALERNLALHGEDSGVTLDSLVMLGLLRDDVARYAEAEKLFRRAIEIGRGHLPAGDPRTVRAEVALGRALINRSRHADAVPVLEEALRQQTEAGAPARDTGVTVGMLANAHFYLGNLAEADALNRRTLELDRKTLGDRHPDVSDDLYNLGAIQQQWGHHAEAERYHREALAISRGFYGADNPEVGSGLTHLGRALIGQDKLAEAGAVLTEALRIYERAYGTSHPRIASTVGELGHLAVKQARLDDAEAFYTRQRAIYRELLDPTHYLHAVATANLAALGLERGDLAGAEKLYREALTRYRQALPRRHPTTASIEVRLGGVLVRQGNLAEAEGHILAGHAVLVEAAPDVKWVAAARKDLVAIYEARGQAEKAARYR